MAPEKVTKMVLDVDLKCSDCYKKVKKVIAKIPEIRDQEYDVEKNKVKITVCCNPERIRDKLCYKGGNSIQKVDIVPDKPKEPAATPKPKPKLKETEKPKDDDKANDDKPDPTPKVAKMMFEAPVQGYPQMYPPSYPVVAYGYQGYPGAHGMPGKPPESSGCYVYDDFFSDENPQGCSVM